MWVYLCVCVSIKVYAALKSTSFGTSLLTVSGSVFMRALYISFSLLCVSVCVRAIDETEHSTYFSSTLIGWCSCKHPSLYLSLSLLSVSLSLAVTLTVSLFLIGCCILSFHPSMAPSQWGDRIGFLLDKALPFGCRGDNEVKEAPSPYHSKI